MVSTTKKITYVTVSSRAINSIGKDVAKELNKVLKFNKIVDIEFLAELKNVGYFIRFTLEKDEKNTKRRN